MQNNSVPTLPVMSIASLHKPHKGHYTPLYIVMCLGCGAQPYPCGCAQCPVCGTPCHNFKKNCPFAKACHSELTPASQLDKSVLSASADILSVAKTILSNIQHVTSTDPGLTIIVNITSPNGSVSTQTSQI